MKNDRIMDKDIRVRLNKDLKQKVFKKADSLNMSMSYYVRSLLTKDLDSKECSTTSSLSVRARELNQIVIN